MRARGTLETRTYIPSLLFDVDDDDDDDDNDNDDDDDNDDEVGGAQIFTTTATQGTQTQLTRDGYNYGEYCTAAAKSDASPFLFANAQQQQQ